MVSTYNIDQSFIKTSIFDPRAKLKELKQQKFIAEGKDQQHVQKEKIKQKLIEFSGAMWGIMLNQMHATVKPDPLTGAGNAEETFRSLQIAQMGEEIAKSGKDPLTELFLDQFMSENAVPYTRSPSYKIHDKEGA